ncbi:MAG: potassium transporter TrkG [bacterium]
MIFKPTLVDIKSIGYYLGKIVIGYGLLLFIPFIISLCYGEYPDGLNLAIGLFCCLIAGYGLLLFCPHTPTLSWMQGMVVVSLAWLLFMFLGAIPLWLSGHFTSYLDACFDSMSGLATVGLSLFQDLDHASHSIQMWRFLQAFVGGQGMILIAVIFLSRVGGVSGLYAGEGREDRILPNITHTAREIWKITFICLCLGTCALWIAGINDGFSPQESFWHGLWLFISSWDTCGFAPQGMGMIYYHSRNMELITMICFILGSMSFALHHSILSGNRKEIFRDIEIIVLVVSVTILFAILCKGLQQNNIYPNVACLVQKGLYILMSAHTTTGHQTVYPSQFINEWGQISMCVLIIAMAIGACAGSTGGGIKLLRIGIIIKGIIQDITRLAAPDSAIIKDKFHHIKDIFLDDKVVRAALLITLLFIFIYGIGALIGVCYGYPFLNAIFESVSTASGTGLSCGITALSMPDVLKIVYIFEMWAGRLEFMSVLALIGFVMALAKR